MTTLVNGGRQRIPLDRIAIGDNVRELDADHVDALAASIKLRGLVVPVIVRAAGDDYELVAGYHRVAAHKKLGEANIDAEIRDVDTEHADRAIENVARKQLNPYEEAQAVRAMLADGRLTEDGAAQALGWSRAPSPPGSSCSSSPNGRSSSSVPGRSRSARSISSARSARYRPSCSRRSSTSSPTATNGRPSA